MCLSFKMKWRVVVLNGTGLSLSDPLRGSHMYKLPSSLQLTPMWMFSGLIQAKPMSAS